MKNEQIDAINSGTLKNLLELTTAYQKSNVLFTFVELEIAEMLKDKGATAAAIAKKTNIDKLAMERFLNSAVIAGLLERRENVFSNSEMTNNFLLKENEFDLRGQVERHHRRSSKVWSKLTGNLKNWRYGDDQKSAPDEADQGAKAMEEQHYLALLHGFALAKVFDFSRHRKILDLGGGTGATSIALCRSVPGLHSIVYELPENVKVAEKFVAKNDLKERIEVVSGDFKTDELPDDFDAVLLANFMSVADAATNKKLLKKLYKKLPDGGACILSGWIIDDSHLAPPISVLFCLEDICWNAPDVERSEKIYRKWLSDAKFKKIECKTYLEPTKILYGFK